MRPSVVACVVVLVVGASACGADDQSSATDESPETSVSFMREGHGWWRDRYGMECLMSRRFKFENAMESLCLQSTPGARCRAAGGEVVPLNGTSSVRPGNTTLTCRMDDGQTTETWPGPDPPIPALEAVIDAALSAAPGLYRSSRCRLSGGDSRFRCVALADRGADLRGGEIWLDETLDVTCDGGTRCDYQGRDSIAAVKGTVTLK